MSKGQTSQLMVEKDEEDDTRTSVINLCGNTAPILISQ